MWCLPVSMSQMRGLSIHTTNDWPESCHWLHPTTCAMKEQERKEEVVNAHSSGKRPRKKNGRDRDCEPVHKRVDLWRYKREKRFYTCRNHVEEKGGEPAESGSLREAPIIIPLPLNGGAQLPLEICTTPTSRNMHAHLLSNDTCGGNCGR